MLSTLSLRLSVTLIAVALVAVALIVASAGEAQRGSGGGGGGGGGGASNRGGDNGGEDAYAEDYERDSHGDPKKGSGKPKFPGTGSYEAWQASLPNFEQGMQLMRQAQWDQAINHFRAALALYPYEQRCWMQIGRALEAKGATPADAEDAYRSALKLDANNWRAWKRLANVLYTQKRYGEARQAISNALNMKVPNQAHNEMDKMIRMIDSGEKGATTNYPG